MWAILGLTLGLAGIVSRHKAQSRPVTLAKPVLVGDLMIRLPEKWHFSIIPSEDGTAVRGREPASENDRSVRAMVISDERLGKAAVDAEEYLSNNILNAGVHTQPIKFSGLHRDGVVAEIDKLDEEDSSEGAGAPGLYACAVVSLPDGQALAVVVTVEDIPPFSAGDRELLRQVVDAITLSPGAGSRTP